MPSSESSLALAGALSGATEAVVVQPFDMVKTRHQLNASSNEGVWRTLKSLHAEGGVSRFYRGMAAEVVGMVPKSSGMYATYEMARRKLETMEGFGPSSLSASIAGCISGVPEAIIVTPAQIIKVRVQAKEHLGRYTGSIDCLTKVIRQEGFSALAIGLGPTLWRNCVWNTVYFGTMHWLKQQLPKPPTRVLELGSTLVTGFAGAVFATCFNAPFDVVKSRFQSQLAVAGQPLKYRNTLQSLFLIQKEEGFSSCYKGFKPKAIRMGLGGSVAMATFEFLVPILP